jgi:hypothetical protein
MWRITGKIENDPAVIQVGLQRFLPRPSALQPVNQPLQIPIVRYRALVDTGAQITAITERAAVENGLVSHSLSSIVSGGGTRLHRHFSFFLSVECVSVEPGDAHPRSTIYVLPEPQDAIEIEDNQMFDVIVGMNILKRCDMQFDRYGKFIIEIPRGAFGN